MMMIMIMVCNDLMCTYKLTRSQLSLAHSAKGKIDMPEKNEKQAARVHGFSLVSEKVEDYVGKDLWKR